MFERSSKGDCEGTTMLLVEGMLVLFVEAVTGVEAMVFGSDTMKKICSTTMAEERERQRQRQRQREICMIENICNSN